MTAPPPLCSAIRRIYMNNKVRLVLGKIDTSILFKVGLKQKDSAAPILFLFIMMVFAETFEREWVKNHLQMIKFKRQSNSPQTAGRITSHLAKTFSHWTLFKIFCMLYVNDGTFALKTRKDLEIVSYLVFKYFAHFGPIMKIGSRSKPSKTECIFLLPLVTLNYQLSHQLHLWQISLLLS